MEKSNNFDMYSEEAEIFYGELSKLLSQFPLFFGFCPIRQIQRSITALFIE